MECRSRAVAWVKDDPFGVEFAEIQLAPGRLTAAGVAIGSWPVAYRLDYVLETSPGFVTSRLRVSSIGEGWRRSLQIQRDEAGIWSAAADEEGDVELPPAGGDPTSLASALDCDLGLSPVTNLLPILRNDLLSVGGSVELIAAWVSVPDLSVHADGQRYVVLRMTPDERVIRYEATDGTFAADITVDTDGVAIDYPGIGRRLYCRLPRPKSESRPSLSSGRTCSASATSGSRRSEPLTMKSRPSKPGGGRPGYVRPIGVTSMADAWLLRRGRTERRLRVDPTGANRAHFIPPPTCRGR